MPGNTPLILVADDQADVREALRLLLKSEGCQCRTTASPAAALSELDQADFDLVLIDLNYARDTTSGREGLNLLAQIRARDASLPVVVMTAWGTVELAVEAMRQGAGDFVQKPWENERLITIVRNQVALRRANRRGQRLEAENRLLRGELGSALIAQSAAMRPVLEVIERVAGSEANILLLGENGTGKGLAARVIHSLSTRADRPFVTANMGGFPEGVFESEMFGHVKGAFTDARTDRMGRFEMADGGTLFLDEIANLTTAQQTRLLRVLETGEFERVGSSRSSRADVRIISATNADVRSEVGAGRFRQDLLFRLNTIEIHLPPLRQRTEDIPLLAAEFLGRHARNNRKPLATFEPAALQALLHHAWPGNVRELDHVIERAVLMARGSTVQTGDLGLYAQPASEARLEDMSLDEVERFLIRKTLARFEGNAVRAAEALGLSRSAFYRRLEKHGL